MCPSLTNPHTRTCTRTHITHMRHQRKGDQPLWQKRRRRLVSDEPQAWCAHHHRVPVYMRRVCAHVGGTHRSQACRGKQRYKRTSVQQCLGCIDDPLLHPTSPSWTKRGVPSWQCVHTPGKVSRVCEYRARFDDNSFSSSVPKCPLHHWGIEASHVPAELPLIPPFCRSLNFGNKSGERFGGYYAKHLAQLSNPVARPAQRNDRGTTKNEYGRDAIGARHLATPRASCPAGRNSKSAKE